MTYFKDFVSKWMQFFYINISLKVIFFAFNLKICYNVSTLKNEVLLMKKLFLILSLVFVFILTACEFTFEDEPQYKIDLIVDTKKVTVESADDADWYKLDIENSDDLQYIIITIKITDDEYLNSSYKLIINDKLIESKKYTIKNNVITYKMDDPNWSDFI